MIMPTNCEAEFFKETTNWEGKDTLVSLGTYECWNEVSSVFGYVFPWMTPRKTAKDSPIAEVARGTLFVFDDVDVVPGDKVDIDGETFNIVGMRRRLL